MSLRRLVCLFALAACAAPAAAQEDDFYRVTAVREGAKECIRGTEPLVCDLPIAANKVMPQSPVLGFYNAGNYVEVCEVDSDCEKIKNRIIISILHLEFNYPTEVCTFVFGITPIRDPSGGIQSLTAVRCVQ